MRYLFFLLAFTLFFKGYTQSVRYKDIAPMIESTSDEYALSVLKEFISTNLDHPAANLRIAALYIKQAQKADPLIEYEKIQALATEAKQRLFKASILIDEKEVKKNEDYYMWIVRLKQLTEVNYPLIKQFIDEEKSEINKMLNQLTLVYNDFTNSVGFYDQAVKEFMQVSSTYSSLKNLYMLYDDKLDEKFTSIKLNYDSCLLYFDRYKAETDTFPLKGYNQKLTVKPINIYRYDGLVSQVNFLKDDVEIWDYATWVDTVRSVVQGEIAGVRKLLDTNEDRQDNAIKNLTSGTNGNDNVIEVDKSIVFNLLRYDYNNPIVPLLKYKESKQKLLLEQANDTYYDTAKIGIERKLVYYNKMLYNIRDSDSLIAQFNSRFDPVRMHKYEGFLDKYYGGIDGSKQYMFAEKNDLRKDFGIYGTLFKEGVESIRPVDSIGTYTKYKTLKIPLAIQAFDSEELANGSLFTTKMLETPDGGYYLAGFYGPDKKSKNSKVFLASLNPKKTVKWFNEYDIEIDSAGTDSNNSVAAITLTNEGVALLIHSKQMDKDVSITTFIHVLQDGTLKNAKRLNSNLFPRKLLFNEEQSNFLACFTGATANMVNSERNKLDLVNINSLGEQAWVYSDSETGGYVDAVTTQNGILIIRNILAGGNSSVLLTTIDNGKKTNEKSFFTNAADQVNRVFKLNDSSISLMGADYFSIVNAKLEMIYP
ncbi:MAG: hypothetical protein KDC79_01810 [Cyclobacteriaceae bacterium]|nr:hypothetical protein [Cyclobacteriaceae bacterium]